MKQALYKHVLNECMNGGSTFLHKAPGSLQSISAGGSGEESREGELGYSDQALTQVMRGELHSTRDQRWGRTWVNILGPLTWLLAWAFHGQVTTSMLCCPPRSGLRTGKTKMRPPEYAWNAMCVRTEGP